jgi:hypothetical protein
MQPHRRIAGGRIAAAAAIVIALGAGVPAPSRGATTTVAATPLVAAAKAIAWLKTQVSANGSLGNNLSLTSELVLAVKAARQDPNSFHSPSPVAYLRSRSATILGQNVGVIGKVALAVEAAGANPYSFGGVNLIHAIRSKDRVGLFDTQLFDQSFAMMALRASVQPTSSLAFFQVLRQQDSSGGWGFAGPGDPDTNSTSVAIQALQATSGLLHASPLRSRSLLAALKYLHAQQNADGAFPYQRTSQFCASTCPSDANSTAYVIQALVAAGGDPRGGSWRKNGRDPMNALVAMQASNGSFAGVSPLIATVQAVPGLVALPFVCIASARAC